MAQDQSNVALRWFLSVTLQEPLYQPILGQAHPGIACLQFHNFYSRLPYPYLSLPHHYPPNAGFRSFCADDEATQVKDEGVCEAYMERKRPSWLLSRISGLWSCSLVHGRTDGSSQPSFWLLLVVMICMRKIIKIRVCAWPSS